MMSRLWLLVAIAQDVPQPARVVRVVAGGVARIAAADRECRVAAGQLAGLHVQVGPVGIVMSRVFPFRDPVVRQPGDTACGLSRLEQFQVDLPLFAPNRVNSIGQAVRVQLVRVASSRIAAP